MVQKTSLFFPIENLTRELDFRLFMAVLASRPNRRIFVGHPWRFKPLYDSARGGVFVGKTFLDPSTPIVDLTAYNKLKENDITVVLLEEEGGFFPGDEESWRMYLDHRLDPNILQLDDFALTWGTFQAEHYRERAPELTDRIFATGHPRFDLYKRAYRDFFSDQVDRLRERFGRFILINTSSGLGNHSRGDDFVFESIYERGEEHPEWQLTRLQLWTEQKIQLAHFVQIIYQLARTFPDLAIVSRPHPSESKPFYESAFQGLPNVFVAHEGPVAPWIFASELVIQEGCTTAVEAFLANKPLISYSSLATPSQEQRVLKQFGIRCESPDEVIEATRDVLEGRQGVVHRMNDEARQLFLNFEADAMQPVLDIIDRAEDERQVTPQAPDVVKVMAGERVEAFKAELKKPLRRLFSSRQRVYESLIGQFPGFNHEEIHAKLRTIQEMTGHKVDYEILSPWLIVFDGA